MTYDELIDHYKSAAAAAAVAGVSRQAVHLWLHNSIPIERQIQIEVLSKGALRADVPVEIRRRERRK